MALIAHTSGNTSTGTIDTSGATFLVAVTHGYLSIPTMGDSYSNTWSVLPGFSTYAVGPHECALWYTTNPIVGAGHSFFVFDGSFQTMCVEAHDGVDTSTSYDGNFNGASQSASPGAITPANANSLLVVCAGFLFGGTANSIDSGFTITDNAVGGGSNFGSALAYLYQSGGPSSVNPTWNFSSGGVCASIASFKTSSPPPPPPATGSSLLLMGVA